MRLIMFRHSIREDLNESNCSITDEGVNLIEKEMQVIGPYYMPNPQLILTSPYQRCLETSYCVSGYYAITYKMNLLIQIDDDIRETIISNGTYANIGTPLKKKFNLTEYDNWDTIKQRCFNFLNKIAHYSMTNNIDNIIAVSHGGILNIILSLLDSTFKFNTTGTDPSTYVPKYFNYIVLDFNKTTRIWTIVCKNF